MDSILIPTCTPPPTSRPLPIHKAAAVESPIALLAAGENQISLEAATPLLAFASHPARAPSNDEDETLEPRSRRPSTKAGPAVFSGHRFDGGRGEGYGRGGSG